MTQIDPTTEIPRLNDCVAEVLTKCLEQGFQLPFVFCVINRDGNIFAARFDGFDKEMETLAEHYVHPLFQVPMRVVVMDQRNECAVITIATTGPVWH